MKLLTIALCTSLSLFISDDAKALGAVSRACQFSTLTGPQQSVAAPFFYKLGADASVLQLPFQPVSEQQKYWVNESLTVDWFSVKYYLFASASVYAWDTSLGTYPGHMHHIGDWYSAQWTAEEVSLQMKSDSRFSIFFANRGLLYSARAGAPTIGRYEDPAVHPSFVTEGTHHYYDPTNKVMGNIAYTRANNCNLDNWGQDKGLFDR